MKNNKKQDAKGKGYQSRFAIDVKGKMKVGKEPEEEFSFEFDMNITTENINYAIQAIAGGIAQAANKIAQPTVVPGPAATPVAAK